MTLLYAIACLAIAFTPSLVVFVKIVAEDPLRIILFFLGAFFWLVSVLVSGVVALTLPSNVPILFFSALAQEAARIAFFALLHRAQKDIEKVAAKGVELASLQLSFSSRHVLAVVCGLGMGVMAALLLLGNVLADYSAKGIVGLPAQVLKKPELLQVGQASFPVSYSISNCILIFDHVAWTIIMWDALHNYVNKLQPRWYISASLPVFMHLLNTFISLHAQTHKVGTLLAQTAVLLVSALHCYLILRKPTSLQALSERIGVVTTRVQASAAHTN